ncbi:ArnT family glycosyltransferase [Haloferax namakaokahaiae]|uniref:ArnT family glycosyltransferase n=1 Tax=Haloferax namakaokahaiae TaxID=1748331 RepID=A0ABD5ZJZ6_9EURY
MINNSPFGTRQLDTFVATAVLVLAIVLFPLRFFASQILIETVPIVLGGASVVFLAVKYYGHEDASFANWQLSEETIHVLRAATIVGLGGMVSVGLLTDGRTVPFFMVASVVGTLIFVQILFSEESALQPSVIIGELLAFALILRGIALLTTPGLIGVDTWTHVFEFAGAIREAGELSGMSESKYFAAPLYHLFLAVAGELFHSSLRTALYVSLGFAIPFSTLLIYFTSRYFLSVRWSLLALAMYSVSDHVVRWGLEIIPTSMGVAFFLAIFYGAAKIYVSENRRPLYALVLFFCLAIVLTHQISSFVALVFLGAGMVTQLGYRYALPERIAHHLYDSRKQVNFVGLFAFTMVVTFVDWMYTPLSSESFLTGMIDLFRRQFEAYAGFLNIVSNTSVTSSTIESLITTIPVTVGLIDTLGFLLLLLVTLIGSFTLLRQNRLKMLHMTWLISAGIMLFVALGMPIFGIYTFVPNRWFAFLFVPMALAAAFGLRYLTAHHPSKAIVVGILIFAVVFPGATMIGHKGTPDDPVFNDIYPEFSYTESELQAAETISSIHPSGETLQTDHPYWTVYERRQQDDRMKQFELTDRGTIAADAAVYRPYQTEGAPKATYNGELLRVQLPHDSVCGPARDTVYTIGSVEYCR